MKVFDVAHLASQRASLKAEEMYQEIKTVIYSYSEEMPLALSIGVLEIVKKDLINEGLEDD